MKTKKAMGILWIALIALVAFYFSNGLGLIIRLVPWSMELRLARTINSNFHPDICQNGDPKTEQVLQKLISRLYPLPSIESDKKIGYNIKIIHSDQVNAFASLGGDIFVLSGLLKDVNTPEELAGILAHEMAHVSERHVLQGILVKIIFSNSNISENFFNIGFTRGEEHEADVLGLERLKKANISAKGYYDFFNRREKDLSQWLALLSDHPGNDERRSLAQKYLGNPGQKILDNDEWVLLKNYCR